MKTVRTAERRGGFTFVEVMAALVFAAIVLPTAMKGISLATNAASQARRRAEATVLGRNLITELSAAGVPALSESEGTFSENPDYRWTAEVSDWEATDSSLQTTVGTNLKQLQVKVIWKARNSERSVSLATLIYKSGS
jgi:type II secretory pathway pseudopilin PulG